MAIYHNYAKTEQPIMEVQVAKITRAKMGRVMGSDALELKLHLDSDNRTVTTDYPLISEEVYGGFLNAYGLQRETARKLHGKNVLVYIENNHPLSGGNPIAAGIAPLVLK
jgi:hypothetical protein